MWGITPIHVPYIQLFGGSMSGVGKPSSGRWLDPPRGGDVPVCGAAAASRVHDPEIDTYNGRLWNIHLHMDDLGVPPFQETSKSQ